MGNSRDQDNEILARLLLDGLVKFAVPGMVIATAGTYYMRRRVASLKATPVERWVLTGMHYWASTCLGATMGMWVYDRMVLEQAFKEEKKRRNN
ncbi:hypothetical protein RRG08_038139 [Elysia crispata]|uniref:HIG1 domain-containing protein n=1 Tax=Elysia crispata TaxID=231223 RepID=A0AAE0ZY83_9GAST|nr:hypothetical protein RRG08_038139 [Elysia crispata]